MTRPADGPANAVRVVVVGAGPSGLTAAAKLATAVDGPVLVLEREREAGGIPRHSDHLGYGIRDLHRFISGPAYARRLTRRALDAGVTIETEAMVTGWAGPRTLEVTSPRGRRTMRADAIVLATGARERPRTARLIPGDRPDGVYTTGQLQNMVHIEHLPVGRRAVIIGAELVSWSAVMTLREAGCQVVAMVSGYERPEAYLAFSLPGRTLLRGPVITRSRVTQIIGKHRVEAVEVEDLNTRSRQRIECDTVITTGDWIPDHELARLAGIDIDPSTRGPAVDTRLATSREGIFAVGNLLHPVDTADAAALDGTHVVPHVKSWLDKAARPSQRGLALRAEEPFRWVSPQFLSRDQTVAPRGQLLLWSEVLHHLPVVTASQDQRVIGRRLTPWSASPGRVFRVPFSLVSKADPNGGPITISLSQ